MIYLPLGTTSVLQLHFELRKHFRKITIIYNLNETVAFVTIFDELYLETIP